MAICSIGDGSAYLVEPRDCKYDAFKVKQGRVTYEFMLKGWTFKDRLPNGPGKEDSGKDYWDIHISGTGFEGESIDVIVSAGRGGYWDYGMSYTFNRNEQPK